MKRDIYDFREFFIARPYLKKLVNDLIVNIPNNIYRLEIVEDDDNGDVYAEVEWLDRGKMVTTQLWFDYALNLTHQNCSCGQGYYWYCEHEGALFEHIYASNYDLPYLYESPFEGDWEAFVENYFDQQLLSRRLNAASNLLDTLGQGKAIDIFTQSQEPIHLEFALPENFLRSNFEIRFKMGTERMYFVKNILAEIVHSIDTGHFLKQGKNQSIQVRRDLFDEESQAIVDFILNNTEVIEDKFLYITLNNIDTFLEIFPGNSQYQIQKQVETIPLSVEKTDNLYTISLPDNSGTHHVITKQNLVYFHDDQTINYTPATIFDYQTFKTLTDHHHKIVFDDVQLRHFNHLLEEESLIFTMQLPDDAMQEEVDSTPTKLYFDLTDDDKLTLHIESNGKDQTQLDAIQHVMELFGADKSLENYTITSSQQIDRFLSFALNNMQEFGQVYVSDYLQQLKRPKKISLNMGVSVSDGVLNLTIDSEDYSVKELMDILKSYRNKRHFHRFKNGQRLYLESQQLEQLDQTFQELGLTQITKKNTEIPLYRMYQIDDLPEDALTVQYDKSFDAKFDVAPLPIDSRLHSTLRDYQVEGVEWLLKLRALGLSGILADDMGLGKTLQILSYLESIQHTLEQPVLIVTPASLIYNWEAELNKFNSPLSVKLILGDKAERSNIINEAQPKDIWLTTYDYLRRDSDWYSDLNFDTIILDEAHAIKNSHTKTAKVVKQLKAPYRFALTGTPIENTLAELWSIFDFLMPGYLYSYSRFKQFFETPIVNQQNADKEERLRKMLDPFILRRMKQDVLTELPEKIEETYYVSPTEEERKLYQANILAMSQQLEGTDVKQNSVQILALLTRLRQLCLDPRLVYDNITQPSSKVEVALDIIANCHQRKEQVLVFSSFKRGLDLLAESCSDRKIKYAMLTGDTTKEQRKHLVEQFQNGEITVFLISLKAGGTGLNLTQATTVIHLDPWWNQSAQNQATDRAYRIGQKQRVQVYQLVMKDTIEERIEIMKERKSQLSDQFIGASTGGIAQLSEQEIKDLFQMID